LLSLPLPPPSEGDRAILIEAIADVVDFEPKEESSDITLILAWTLSAKEKKQEKEEWYYM
tara:strand:+ start:143 stop:322 length:180 start_codon:yes stop_codon:yes gene_type:complete